MTAQPKAPRRVPALVWAGAALLVVTMIGASKALPSNDNGAAPGGGEANGDGAPDRVPAFGHVTVPGDPTPLHPAQPGRVMKVNAAEGKIVEAGAELLVMDDEIAQAQLAMAAADVKAAREQLRQAQRLAPHRDRLKKAQAEVIAAKKGEQAAAQAKARLARRLADKKNGPEEDAEAAEAAAAALAAAVRAEEVRLEMLDDDDPQIAVNRAEADLEGKLGQQRKAEKALAECVVKAPSRGAVLRCNVSAGEMLGPTPRQPALLFCPDVPRIVRVEVEQEFAAYVFAGQAATVEDDTRSGPKFRGKVTHVSDWFTHRRSVLLEPLQFNDVRTLECLVEVDPKATFRIGQRVRVTLQPGS